MSKCWGNGAICARNKRERDECQARIAELEAAASRDASQLIELTVENAKLRAALLEFCDKGHSIEREQRARALMGRP